VVAQHLGRVATPDRESVVALNTALMGDGALIHVAKGATVDRPIHLVFAATGDKPASVFTRSLVVIEQGARAMLVESHDATAGQQVNTALELVVGDNAHVDHIKITGGPDDLIHVSSLMATVGAHARFNDFAFNIGGGVVRNQTFIRFDGEGTLAGLRGTSLLKGKQHVDSTLLVDHKASGCQSREVFATVLDDESRGVFQGKIVVRPHAQQTDARMMTRALLLSDEAEADNKPELEIFADDVQCGHGATTGALDEDLKFYLMARGIPEVEAESLLVQAFVGEAIEGIEHAGLRDALMAQVVAWLRKREG
jgi:Fe-S cluster assembly protein SufD